MTECYEGMTKRGITIFFCICGIMCLLFYWITIVRLGLDFTFGVWVLFNLSVIFPCFGLFLVYAIWSDKKLEEQHVVEV
jgi:hypothetical protein